MSLSASIRSRTRPPLNHHAAGEASTSLPSGDVDAALPLPRHLLVALAGIAADVTSLRAQVVDEPPLREPLDRILGRVDGLVDDIYERAANPAAHPAEASNGHGSAITAGHPATAAPAGRDEHRDTEAQRPL